LAQRWLDAAVASDEPGGAILLRWWFFGRRSKVSAPQLGNDSVEPNASSSAGKARPTTPPSSVGLPFDRTENSRLGRRRLRLGSRVPVGGAAPDEQRAHVVDIGGRFTAQAAPPLAASTSARLRAGPRRIARIPHPLDGVDDPAGWHV